MLPACSALEAAPIARGRPDPWRCGAIALQSVLAGLVRQAGQLPAVPAPAPSTRCRPRAARSTSWGFSQTDNQVLPACSALEAAPIVRGRPDL